MAESNVIKEFLVAIGYKADEAALKKISHGVGQASKVLVGLALAAEAAAVTVAASVMKMASNLETLYFASLRTDTSATHIKAFARAAQDFGASAGEAQGSIEGLARFIRSNPAAPNFLNSLLTQVGRSAFDANGHLNDTTTNLEALGEFFAKNKAEGHQFLNPQYAAMLGIDEKTMLAIQDGSFKHDLDEINDRLNRAGFQHATEGAHAFMKSLRVTGDELLIFGVRIVDVLQDKFKISLDGVNNWFEKNGDYWADRIAGFIARIWDDFNKFLAWVESPEGWAKISRTVESVFGAIETAYKIIKPVIIWLFDQFVALDTATGGWSTKLIALVAILGALGVPSLLMGIMGLVGGIAKLGIALASAVTSGGALATTVEAVAGAGAASLLGIGAGVAGGIGLGWGINRLFPDGPLARIGNGLGDWWRRHVDGSPEARRQMVYDTLKDSGASPNMAAAMMKVFSVESNMDPHAQGDFNQKTGRYEAYGIGQWHADRQQDFGNQFGHDMSMSSLEEQLKFALHEKDKGAQAALMAMRVMKNQDDMVDVYVRQSERPASPEAEINKANRMPNFLQPLTFHITEAHDATITAKAIRTEIDRANAALFRNLSTPVAY